MFTPVAVAGSFPSSILARAFASSSWKTGSAQDSEITPVYTGFSGRCSLGRHVVAVLVAVARAGLHFQVWDAFYGANVITCLRVCKIS